MQLGISSYSYPWAVGVPGSVPPEPLGASALVQKAQHFGLSRVQFGDNLPLHEVEQVAALGQMGLQIEAGTRRLEAQHLRRYLAIATKVGSPFLRVVIDDTGYTPSESQAIAVIGQVIDEFRQAQVVLAIENHDRFSVASLRRIIQATDPQWVGVCLDTANSLGVGEGLQEVVMGLAPYTVNLHVKDFNIERVPHKMGFVVRGCPAGQGMLNVPWILEHLAPYRRCLSATLEVWSNPLADLPSTLAQEEAWVVQSLQYLKPFFDE